MNRLSADTKGLLKRKIATLVLVTASVGAFATLGDDSGKGIKKESSVLLPYSAKNFSLRSNYNYKGNSFFRNVPEKRNFISLNPMVSYQKGNTAYVLPLKKIPLLGKIRFSPSPAVKF